MVNIFILCYNEEVLIHHTITHYRRLFPDCNITIMDNKSTDKSVEIAENMGCKIHSWHTGDEIDDWTYTDLKNNIWKEVNEGWVIVCDMDEWLYITEEQLQSELDNGYTFINSHGYHIVANSETLELDDICLHDLKEGEYWRYKPMCFHRPDIEETNFDVGTRNYKGKGNYKITKNKYYFKHQNFLGLKYYINKIVNRAKRRKGKTPAGHYFRDVEKITDIFNTTVKNKITIDVFQ